MAENMLSFHVLEPAGHESCMSEGDVCPSTVSEVVVSLQDVRAAWVR